MFRRSQFTYYQINLENTVNSNSSIKRGDIQYFREGEEPYEETWHFMRGLHNPLETMLY